MCATAAPRRASRPIRCGRTRRSPRSVSFSPRRSPIGETARTTPTLPRRAAPMTSTTCAPASPAGRPSTGTTRARPIGARRHARRSPTAPTPSPGCSGPRTWSGGGRAAYRAGRRARDGRDRVVAAELNNELHAAKTVAEGGTGNIQVKISKESAAKTASHLFQTNFSGRAELGLTGDDNLHVKVSADGAAWIEALVFAAATGAATFGAPTVTAASAASGAGLRLPHGVAPTAPVNGDLWSTTAGWFVRTNGATQQLEVYNAAATFAGVNVGGALTGATAGSFSGAVSTAALSATSGTFTSALSVNNGAELNVWGPGSTVRLRFVNDGTTGYLQGAALNLCGIGGGNTVATVTGSLQVAGVVSPGADNTYTLGSASFRWSQLYAGTATINTSDAREKTALAEVPEALLDAVLAVPIGAYQWLDSVARKGPDGARIHFGPTAQHVRDAILAKGSTPSASRCSARTRSLLAPPRRGS